MQFACSVSAFFVFYTWVNPYVHLNNIRNFNLWRVHLQGVSLFQYTKLSKNPVSSFHSDLPLNLNKILFWRNLKSLFKKYSIWIYFFGLLVKTVLSALTISHELFWVTKKWQSKKIFFSLRFFYHDQVGKRTHWCVLQMLYCTSTYYTQLFMWDMIYLLRAMHGSLKRL